jgi:acyl carrier protein
MTPEEIRTRLERVFQKTFDIPVAIRDEMTANDIEDWNSLTHIQLIAAIEDEFRMRFTTSEVVGLREVGDIVNIILKRAPG